MIRRFRWPLALGAVLTVNAALWLAQFGFALPQPLKNYLLGPKMIRAEVIVKTDGVVHDIRVDRGRIRNISGNVITIAERDGTDVQVQVAPDARVRLNGSPSSLSALHRKMLVETYRDPGDSPAERVFAYGRR